MLARQWFCVGIMTLLLSSLALADPPATHPKTGEDLVIDCLRGTPDAIDGDLSDWNLPAMTPAVLDVAEQLHTGAASWTDASDLSAEFYMLWDEELLYMAVIVKDDALSMNKTGGNIWNADCIEIFFATTNAVAGHAEHYQYGFNANEQTWNWCNMDSAGQSAIDYLQVAAVETADGYICEASIEYRRMESLDWSVGSIIGFHPVLDDTDNGDREIQMTWTSREAHDQSQGYGYLVLSDERAIAKELARDPFPADGATDVPRDVDMSWTAGAYAVTHDVYLGTSFEDVNDATTPDNAGQTETTYDPGILEYGQTYYWRIDEVNGAPDNTVFKGSVWSFTIEPLGVPIENLTVTSNASDDGISTPQKTIDGSGLNENGEHSTNAPDMWLGVPAGADPVYIQYDFDKVYKLHELVVWNYNVQFELVLGFGFKDVTIEYTENGTDWMVLGDAVFAQGTARDDYAANTAAPLNGVAASGLRLTVNSGYGPMGQFGLSEVRILAIPAQAREPQPADGATNVAPDAALSWRAGRNAVVHDVLLGTDAEALTRLDSVSEATYVPGDLEFGMTYYWQINEVNEADEITTWAGDVWSFATQEFAVIDDMESYDDDENRIYDTWLDGFVNDTGATVGYFEAPFAEKSIVNSGAQSMPLEYVNDAAPFYSEAEYDLGSMNLQTNGANSLRLFVAGQAPAFFESADGSILMNAIGNDIWGTADQFRYAYKTLNGNGSMTVRVDDLDASPDGWVKAGVMIRQSTEAGSVNAFTALTGGSGDGATFQWRDTADAASSSSRTLTGIAPPYYVRIVRQGNTFTGYLSADGETWEQQGANAVDVAMTDPVLIGLALTSHNANQATSAAFSEIASEGNVSGNWQIAEIGVAQPEGNTPEPLYVAIEDTSGNVAVATNPDAGATGRPGWNEWIIPYSDLAGVNLSRAAVLYIGVGDRDNPTAGGTGMIFIDDVGYGRPAAGQ